MQIIKMKKVLNSNNYISKWISLKCSKCLVGEKIHSLLISEFCLLCISCLWSRGMHPVLWRHIITLHHYPSSQVLEGGASSRRVDAVFSIQVCGTVARSHDMIFLLPSLLLVKHRMQVIYKFRWSKVSSRMHSSHPLIAGPEMFWWLSFPTSHDLFSVPYFLLMSTLLPERPALVLLSTLLNTMHCGYIHSH